MAELTPYQKDILIKTALGEARGEGVEGMADVLQVILNRANSGQFPSDPAAVALQNKQFSTWNSGKGGNNPSQFKPGSKAYQTAAQALEAVASGARPDPTGGALYYHTPSVSPGWASAVNTNGTVRRNGHVFYPSHPVPPGDIPSVGTLLDTRRSAPSPAIPSIAAANMRSVTSPSGGNTDLQEALNAYATRERNRVTPMTMQGKATTVASIPTRVATTASDRARGQTRTTLTAPGAIAQSVASTRQDPTLAAALARRIAPVSASDKARGSPAQTRNVATTVASFPTATPARLPSTSGVGQAPATRVVPTTRVSPVSSLATARNEQSVQRAVVPPRVTPVQPVQMAMGVNQSYAGQERAPPVSQVRLPASPAGLPANYGVMSPNSVNAIGMPLSNAVSPVNGFRVTQAAPTPLTRPGVSQVLPRPQIAAPMQSQMVPQAQMQPAPVRQPSVFAARVPAQVAPKVVAMPTPRQARPPLAITVQGSNTVQPVALSPIQQLQAQGLTAAQAYARLTGKNNPDAASRVNGKSGLSASGGSYTHGYEF